MHTLELNDWAETRSLKVLPMQLNTSAALLIENELAALFVTTIIFIVLVFDSGLSVLASKWDVVTTTERGFDLWFALSR